MMELNKKQALDIYTRMCRIRKFEEKAVYFYENALVRGSMHVYIGQEAIAACICSYLTDADYITSTHRGHGHIIAKGVDMKGAMAELWGKEQGTCRGRAGSMHITDLEVGCLGANGIVGGGIPIALGSGLSASYKENGRVTACFFGDGASNEGTFHESLNMAALWKLPILFVCENNQYGMSVPAWQSTSVENISDRAAGYGMLGLTVDGNDVIAMCEAMEKALGHIRSGGGPVLMECKTYRQKGHWLGDPQPYRTREEVAQWVEKDPIPKFRAWMLKEGLATESELDMIEQQAAAEADAATEFADQGSLPDPSTLLDDVFYEA